MKRAFLAGLTVRDHREGHLEDGGGTCPLRLPKYRRNETDPARV
eukprot:COSAG06_NODE_46524_length_346_cov_0.825911_2_plen_43_part_01